MIDVLSLFNPIRNDFIYVPESLRIKSSSFTSFDKSLFVLLLSLFSEIEDFLIATVLSSFRISCPIALKVSQRSKPNWISLRSERVRCLCFVIVDLISNSNVSYLIPP